eukprot:2425343-Amphidinium_carterae.1
MQIRHAGQICLTAIVSLSPHTTMSGALPLKHLATFPTTEGTGETVPGTQVRSSGITRGVMEW